MNRTQEEIIERLRTNESRDPFGFTSSDLLEWLDFENAKEFLKEGTSKEVWDEVVNKRKPVVDQMKGYMSFAIEKANDERGLSAGRSMCHYQNWLWLIGEDSLAEEMPTYDDYGKNNLQKVCEFLKLDSSQLQESN